MTLTSYIIVTVKITFHNYFDDISAILRPNFNKILTTMMAPWLAIKYLII